MRISKKIILVTLCGMILLGIVASFLSVSALQKRGDAEAIFARSMMMEEKKSKLQDLIKSAYAIIQAHYDYAHDPEKVAATYRMQLKSIVDVAYTTVAQVHSRTDLNEAEKMRLAGELIGAMRYNEKDYLWINDMGPKMVMHPIKPALNGKDLSAFKDPDGKKLFVEMVNVCRQEGQGTVDYLWPKPGHDQPVAKLSYVKLFKPWNWVIGTGVYLEAAEQRFMEDAKKAIAQLRYGPKGQDYFWINDTGPKMVMHPVKSQLDGKDLSGIKDPNGKNLFVDMVKVSRDKGEGFVDYMWPMPGHDDPVSKLSYVKLFKPWGWIVGTGIYLDDVDQAVNAKEAEIEAAVSSQRNGLIGTILVLLTLTAAGVAFISRRITRPIVTASEMLKDIAEGEGDLTRRLAISSNDEVGEMAKWFNVFIEKLQGIVGDITGGIQTLSSFSTELSAISEQMSQGIQSVSDKSTTVSAAAEEMSTNMNNVAAAMEQSATNTNMVATASEEMSATIGEIAQNAETARKISDEAASKASSASANMEQLGTAANSIGKVIEAITDISEQVNLLALNATIEAARAGEAGKGFAVVANEIKELAKQTATATQNIKAELEGIQGTTSMTVGQIAEITQVITDVNGVVANIATAVEQQSTATKEIANNVAQASQGIQEVNENVNQGSSVSGEISRDIAGVSVAMNEMSTSSGQVNLSAQELSKLSENLKQLVEQFKI